MSGQQQGPTCPLPSASPPLYSKAPGELRLSFPNSSLVNHPVGLSPAQSSPVTHLTSPPRWPRLPSCLGLACWELWPSAWRAGPALWFRGKTWSPAAWVWVLAQPLQRQGLGLLGLGSLLHETGRNLVPAIQYHHEDPMCKQR